MKKSIQEINSKNRHRYSWEIMVNKNRKFCYRIIHIRNLPLLLRNGIVNQNHPKAERNYIRIGNPDIIDVRSTMPVKINGYGLIGDYIPFYFTPRSIMLFNIITGYRDPVIPKRDKNDILVLRCLIDDLMELPRWFFTDGQANIRDGTVNHYNNRAFLKEVDWECIQQSNFSKDDGDYDRPRRYQAEFLVYKEVPLGKLESLNVFDEIAERYVKQVLAVNNINLAVNIQPKYFF